VIFFPDGMKVVLLNIDDYLKVGCLHPEQDANNQLSDYKRKSSVQHKKTSVALDGNSEPD
jgi:hypothetical protein